MRVLWPSGHQRRSVGSGRRGVLLHLLGLVCKCLSISYLHRLVEVVVAQALTYPLVWASLRCVSTIGCAGRTAWLCGHQCVLGARRARPRPCARVSPGGVLLPTVICGCPPGCGTCGSGFVVRFGLAGFIMCAWLSRHHHMLLYIAHIFSRPWRAGVRSGYSLVQGQGQAPLTIALEGHA